MSDINIMTTLFLDFSHKDYQTIQLKQYDKGSRAIQVYFADCGEPFAVNPSDMTVRLKYLKPDGRYIYEDSIAVNEDGSVLVAISENMTARPGNAKAEFLIYNINQSQLISTMPLYFQITESCIPDDAIESTDEFSALTNMTIRCESATDRCIHATEDLQGKLDSHHFVLAEDKGIAGGVPSLDSNAKIPVSELYEADTDSKGITRLTDSVTSESVATAATPRSVKTVNDRLSDEIARATGRETAMENSIASESGRAMRSEEEIMDALDAEIERASSAEKRKADLANPSLKGCPKAPTAPAGTNTDQIATTSFVQSSVSAAVAASDAMIIKGTIGSGGTVSALPSTYRTGWTYRAVSSGTYAGQVCETGDLIIALADRDGSGNSDSDWCVAQTNINGAITGAMGDSGHILCSQSGSSISIAHRDIPRLDASLAISPGYGRSFASVKSVTSDTKGHITGVETYEVTLPDAYVHPSSDGNRHIPANGTANNGKYLKATAEAGVYAWGGITENDIIQALGFTPGSSRQVTYRLSKTGDAIKLTGSDGSETSVPDSNTTYPVATVDKDGIMSKSYVSKLAGISPGAQVNTNSLTGVKGGAESSYHTSGNVNLTPASIGALASGGKAADSSKLNGYVPDFGTKNNSGACLVVLNDKKMQCRDVSSLPFLPSKGGSLTGNLNVGFIAANAIGGMNYPGHSISLETGGVAIKSQSSNINMQSNALQSRNYANTAWAPMYASAFTQQSSRRYKKNILPLPDEMAMQVMQYRPVMYDYINEEDGTCCMGLIAEEVAGVNQYPVQFDAEGKCEGLDYSKFVPQLIRMVQIQQAEIEKLKEKITGTAP